MSVMFIIFRVLFKLVSRDSSKANMRGSGTPPRGRSPRKLRIIRGFDLSVLHSYFDRFEAQLGPKNKLNLVWLGVLVRHLQVMMLIS